MKSRLDNIESIIVLSQEYHLEIQDGISYLLHTDCKKGLANHGFVYNEPFKLNWCNNCNQSTPLEIDKKWSFINAGKNKV